MAKQDRMTGLVGATGVERALLIGIDMGTRAVASDGTPSHAEPQAGRQGKPIRRAGAQAARLAAACSVPGDWVTDATPPDLPQAAAGQQPARWNAVDFSRNAAGDTSGMDAEESLAEFHELVTSAGAEVVGQVIQRRSRPDPATLIGRGKVEEIAGMAASTEASLILFDQDLSPTQLRNLEAALPCRVLDRTQLILDIFARHARTREGQLQVELAQLEYMLPRLTGRGKAMSQLGGGIGTRGPGETQLETDRRRIQRRLAHLREQLDAVRRVRRQQRRRREAVPVPTVALVGYTNAGKSTLFNRLSGAHALESSRMFATLDPKLRAVELPSKRRILLSDTVGFIRNLPHTLVTSFRATLEEVEKAEILIHVRDASSSHGEEQKAQVEKVLGELDALSKPRVEVLNKVDLLDGQARSPGSETGSQPDEPGPVGVSARTGYGIDALLLAIDRALVADPVVEAQLIVPQKDGSALAAIEGGMVIHERAFEGNLVRLDVSGPASLLGRLRQYRVRVRVRAPRFEPDSMRAETMDAEEDLRFIPEPIAEQDTVKQAE